MKKTLEGAFLGMIDVFVSSDGVSIPKGRNFTETIRNAIDRAAYGIVLLSPDSVSRPWVNIEFGAFWILDKPITPLLHGEIEFVQLQPPYNIMNGTAINNLQGLDELIGNIADKIETRRPKVDWAPLHESTQQYWEKRRKHILEIANDEQNFSQGQKTTPRQIQASEMLSSYLEAFRLSLRNLKMSPLSSNPIGGRSGYSEASSYLAERFNELTHIYVNNRAHLTDSFCVLFDLLTEGVQLLLVLREIAQRNSNGLSSKNRQIAAEMSGKAEEKAQQLLNESAQAIKTLLSNN